MKMYKWLRAEFFRIFPVVLFFFIAFSLVDMTQMLMHRKMGGGYYSLLVVALAALVMGKVVAISDHLPCIRLFSKKPLIYSTLWKTGIYVFCSLVVRIFDRAIPFLIEEKSMSMTYQLIADEVGRLPFWIAQAWLAVLFFIFVASEELITVIGKEKVRRLFFGK